MNRNGWIFSYDGVKEKTQIITLVGKINGKILAAVYQQESIIPSFHNDVSNGIFLNNVTYLNDRL